MALQADIVQLPVNEYSKTVDTYQKFYPYLKAALGAFDWRPIALHVPLSGVISHHNRKAQVSQNIFPACTFDMYFSYVLTSWKGSAHDSHVQDARSKGSEIPEGKYYVGDAEYVLKTGCLTPYRRVRYHLREHYLSPTQFIYI